MVDHSLSRSVIPEYGFHYGITHVLEHRKKKAQLVNTAASRGIAELQA